MARLASEKRSWLLASGHQALIQSGAMDFGAVGGWREQVQRAGQTVRAPPLKPLRPLVAELTGLIVW